MLVLLIFVDISGTVRFTITTGFENGILSFYIHQALSIVTIDYVFLTFTMLSDNGKIFDIGSEVLLY